MKFSKYFLALLIFLSACNSMTTALSTATTFADTSTPSVDNPTATVTVSGELLTPMVGNEGTPIVGSEINLGDPAMSVVEVKDGVAAAPIDTCLFKDTAEPQCFVINEANRAQFGKNLQDASLTVSYLETWNASTGKPGKYLSYEQYKKATLANLLQPASGVSIMSHPNVGALLGGTEATWVTASDYTLPDGTKMGTDAKIDLSQIGFRCVDWSVAKNETGFAALTGGPVVREILESVEGQHDTYRIVWEMSDILSLADSDLMRPFGALILDENASLNENGSALTQKVNWFFWQVQRLKKESPAINLTTAGSGGMPKFLWGKKGILTKELMDQMLAGVEYISLK